MKKILLFLVALVATLSMNAQTTEIYKGDTKEATYSGADVTVSFGENSITVKQGTTVDLTYFGSNYKVVSKELPPSTGTAKRNGNFDVNWVQLWKDGPKFAEYNVGVINSKAESCGDYYAWGGSQNKVDDHNTGTTTLSGSDDTAYKLWGEHWRMPTTDELEALTDNCNVQWTSSYNNTGIAGRIFTGKGDYTSNSIFLPAAGYYSGSTSYFQGTSGNYWSSTPRNSDGAYTLFFNSGSQQKNGGNRNLGYSVRPVYVEDIVAVTGVSLNKTTLKVGKGNTETLSATVTPADATNKKVLWTSNNEGVATVDAYGKVTGVASGNCVITATTEDGGKTATCEVEVVVLTTGYAKATIGGKDVDVKWIQLWENGPKFAEYNVDKKMYGADAAKTGAAYVWGANWKTPSKSELNELLLAAQGNSNSKVTCDYTQEGSTWGFKFTGKETGYTSSSVFFPAIDYGSDSTLGYQEYWSSTSDDGGENYSQMILYRTNTGKWMSEWKTDKKEGYDYLVRPVLNEPN